jgi:hypothetical protein
VRVAGYQLSAGITFLLSGRGMGLSIKSIRAACFLFDGRGKRLSIGRRLSEGLVEPVVTGVHQSKGQLSSMRAGGSRAESQLVWGVGLWASATSLLILRGALFGSEVGIAGEMVATVSLLLRHILPCAHDLVWRARIEGGLGAHYHLRGQNGWVRGFSDPQVPRGGGAREAICRGVWASQLVLRPPLAAIRVA